MDKIKAKCHFCIEHIFYEVPGLDKWFYRDATTNIVNFKGDKHKVYFAKNIVSNIDKEYFEVFGTGVV